MAYVYIIWSLFLLLVWLALFFIRRDLNKEMLFGSFLALPFGFAQLLFVPEYWHPQIIFGGSLDIESFIFLFALGGIASVLYEVLLQKHLRKLRRSPHVNLKHLGILIAVWIVAFNISNLLYQGTFREDLIYTWSAASLVSSFVLILVRKDLFKPVFLGGALFLFLYCASLLFINSLFTGWIMQTWSARIFEGTRIFSIPIEELVFSFSFGAVWSAFYEYIYGYKDA